MLRTHLKANVVMAYWSKGPIHKEEVVIGFRTILFDYIEDFYNRQRSFPAWGSTQKHLQSVS